MKTKRYKKEGMVLAPDAIVDQAAREALWQRYEAATAKQKARAQMKLEAVQAYIEFEQRGIPRSEILSHLARRFGEGASGTTVWRDRNNVRGQSPDLWLPLLLPQWKGNTSQAIFTEAAWDWFFNDYFTLSKPAMRASYRRLSNVALRKGWTIPSYDAVKARVEKVDPPLRVLLREGEKALFHRYPAQQRDYTSLQVHDIWVTDGRKADVFAKWEDGSVSRPILLPWLDARSRKILGYQIGQTESADLVRLSFKRAADSCKALPKEALMDNGRGFASKLITGGIENRYRFKVKKEDPIGILKMLGINVMWATPALGRAKPIEPWFKNIAEIEKSPEFVGAYCGNSPANKPENFDPKNAVPIELYRKAVAAEVAAYNARAGHRGDGMDRRSPNQVYDQLIESASVRVPTEEQLRLCMLAADHVKLNKADHSIRHLDNRYWSEKLAKLDPALHYTIRSNPEDASEPVHVYLNEKFICSASCVSKTGFRDREAAKEHKRAHAKSVRAVKEQAKAARAKAEAESWTPEDPDGEASRPTPARSRPKVIELVRLPIQFPTKGEEDTDDIDPDEFKRVVLGRRMASGDA